MRTLFFILLCLSGCVSNVHTTPLPQEAALVAPDKSLQAFKNSCDKPNSKIFSTPESSAWKKICQSIRAEDLTSSQSAELFWHKHFQMQPQMEMAKVSGYYTQELHGSLKPTKQYKTAIYARPETCSECYSRAEIEAGALKGMGAEIFYIKDNVERYFAQLQGAAVVFLDNGQKKRLVVAGNNAHPYHFIRLQGSLQHQREWLYQHPDQIAKILARNPSFIYYVLSDDPIVRGNRGVKLTPGHSIAVDSEYIASGTPILLENRIVIAQDVGRAINGNGRFDLYWGTGQVAERLAGGYLKQSTWSLLVPRA